MKILILITLFMLVGISCQTEEDVINNSIQDNFSGSTALTGKLMRMMQHPTAIDNVVDGTACFLIQFPFTVVVNGQEVAIDAEEDYQTVRNILAEDDNNTDTVTIHFPVNVTYADYTQAAFETQAEFNAAAADCIESTELSCIEIAFPVGVNTYNSQNQLAESFNINNKESLFELLQNLNVYDAIAFNYPINFQAPDGTTIALNSNDELEAAIDNYTDECMALLNPDPDPGPDPDPEFEDILTEGTWHVSYFFRDQDETEDYEDYDFTFNSNGSITVTGGGPSSGSWATYTDDDELELDLNLSSSALDELAEDWTVMEYSETVIKLQKVSGGGDDIRSLHFTKN